MSQQCIFVFGAGTMGSGIAQVAATSGFVVTCVDSNTAQLEKARASINASTTRLLEKKKISPEQKDAAEAIRFTSDLQEVKQADLVIEAIAENPEAKIALFRQLDQAAPAGAILASNTSSISITRLAGATLRPDKVIGMHFMNPVPVMSLVEVIRGLQTSNETMQMTLEICQAMGKTPVEANDAPGFIANRILCPMINEAIFALQEGIGTPEAIDSVMKLGANHPMGPLALADLIGLDVVLAILEVLQRDLGEDKYRPAPLLRKMVYAGWLGRKTSQGFYSYPR